MQIQTSRFGPLSVSEERIATFPHGLVGFHDLSRFALVPCDQNPLFNWLQSVEDPDVAFLIVDPALFFRDYAVPVREETVAELQLTDPADVRLFVICNKAGDWLTGNLLGPIALNPAQMLGSQVVLTEKKWMTRQPLAKLQPEHRLAKAA